MTGHDRAPTPNGRKRAAWIPLLESITVLGIQEGAFLILLAPVLPADQAAVLTVAARIWQTLVMLLDAGIGGLVLLVSWGARKQV